MAKHVLVVESENAVRSLIAEALRAEGLEVREAQDGQEALTMVENEPPALVIMDVLLPTVDGFTVCQRIRQLPEPINKTPIIILTAIDTLLGERLAKKMGANLYLTKPFNSRELRRKVRELLLGAEEEGQ